MMFKVLVFLVALEPVILTSWLGLVYISNGKISEGLPFFAISLMCFSYLAKGVVETVSFIQSRLK
jgi:hypothetical protein